MLMILIIFLPKIFINSNIFDINSIFHNVNHYYSFISIFFIVFLLFIRKCLNSRRINKIIILYLYKYKNKIVKFIAKTLKYFLLIEKASRYLLLNLLLAIILQFIIGYSIYLIVIEIFSKRYELFII